MAFGYITYNNYARALRFHWPFHFPGEKVLVTRNLSQVTGHSLPAVWTAVYETRLRQVPVDRKQNVIHVCEGSCTFIQRFLIHSFYLKKSRNILSLIL